MTQEEIINEIRRLPLCQRVELLETISRSVREEQQGNGSSAGDVNDQASREERLAAFHRLHGMLKTDAPPPTDEELKEDYINYLAEKYS